VSAPRFSSVGGTILPCIVKLALVGWGVMPQPPFGLRSYSWQHSQHGQLSQQPSFDAAKDAPKVSIVKAIRLNTVLTILFILNSPNLNLLFVEKHQKTSREAFVLDQEDADAKVESI
jgi:hypothetical protein